MKPHFSSVLAGAFTQTKALGGTVLFSVTITRFGSLFGSVYYDTLSKLIKDTANGLDELLRTLRIAVPRLTAVLAVFVAAAWLFAFVRNLIHLSRYTVVFGRNALTVRHGVITLYETIFPSDTIDSVTVRDTAATLFTGAAPIYRSGHLLIPPLRGEKRRKALQLLCSAPCTVLKAVPPPRAIMGHIAVPLGWGSVGAALLVLTYLTVSDPVLRTLLWGWLWVSVWFCFLYGAYMRRSGMSECGAALVIAARRRTELITAYIPLRGCACFRAESNPFQRRSGICDVRIFAVGRIKLRLRNVCRSDISEPL